MHKIDDNLLAAYLEGNLNDKETEMVEQAIDTDKDLQAIVDDWVAIQANIIAQKVKADIAAREHYKTCAGNESVCHSPSPFDTNDAKRKTGGAQKKNWRSIIMAASVFVLAGLAAFWILHKPNDGNYIPYRDSDLNYKYTADTSGIISIELDTIIVDTPEDSIEVLSDYDDFPVHIIVKNH